MDCVHTISEVLHGISSIHDLPLGLLADVLRNIEQGDRLCFCALVSKRWRQAASMATSNVEYTADHERGMDGLSTWLTRCSYASMIESMQVDCKVTDDNIQPLGPILRVPLLELKKLQRLKLARCQLKGTETATTAASTTFTTPGFESLGALTALSRLDLDVTFLDLSELSSCTGLQHLALCDVSHQPMGGMTVAALEDCFQHIRVGETLPSQLAPALSQLTKLTHLDLWYSNYKQDKQQEQLMSAISEALCHLQQLKELSLSLYTLRAEHLAHLPVSLTALQLDNMQGLTRSRFPRLQELTQLLQLHLSHAEHIDSGLLSSLTQLTSLRLDGCMFRTPDLVTELMTALQRLKQLRLLQLPNSIGGECIVLNLYGGLTASSQLAVLDLTNCYIPDAAIEHILTSQGGMSALSSITTSPDLLRGSGSFKRLVASCPGLQELCITEDYVWEDRIKIDVQGFSALSCLTALTKFSIFRNDVDDEGLRSIGACTQLKDLRLMVTSNPQAYITLNGLMYLTSLTGLTYLKLGAQIHDDAFTECLSAIESGADLHLQLQEAITAYAESISATLGWHGVQQQRQQ